MPLITVELAYGSEFELEQEDATVLIQLQGGDVMWQKERLLNVALDHVPASCKAIAWVDADLLFPEENWNLRACELLERYHTIQLFQDFYDLGPEVDLKRKPWSAKYAAQSLVRAIHQQGPEAVLTPAKFVHQTGRVAGFLRGGAWAARAEVIRKHRFYDSCVLGSGDDAMAVAAFGRFDLVIDRLLMNPGWAEQYRSWAGAYHATVCGNVGFLDVPLFHLWHGRMSDRNYFGRTETLARFNFDPRLDIAMAENGCWRWNSDKPEMHQAVRDYFVSRKEDG